MAKMTKVRKGPALFEDTFALWSDFNMTSLNSCYGASILGEMLQLSDAEADKLRCSMVPSSAEYEDFVSARSQSLLELTVNAAKEHYVACLRPGMCKMTDTSKGGKYSLFSKDPQW